jgi:UTP--glucose-1-phosphate uridylyltransferase
MTVRKIKKAVITAGGQGTRMLPISRAIPKEMLPIIDTPAIAFLVDEAVASGIEEILIITARGKEAIERYFDSGYAASADIYYRYQPKAGGLGEAVRLAKKFTGDDYFAVLYSDDIIIADTPVVKQLAEVYEETGLPVVGVKEVSLELVKKYCTLKTTPLGGNRYAVSTIKEKPKPENGDEIWKPYFSILGRDILPPSVHDVLDSIPNGANGELQLTDAMQYLAEHGKDDRGGIVAVDFEGVRYDMGSKLGFLIANIEQGIKQKEYGEQFKEFLREFARKNL